MTAEEINEMIKAKFMELEIDFWTTVSKDLVSSVGQRAPCWIDYWIVPDKKVDLEADQPVVVEKP